jgi:Fe-S-cluster formation regulator IscX/YfhJ
MPVRKPHNVATEETVEVEAIETQSEEIATTPVTDAEVAEDTPKRRGRPTGATSIAYPWSQNLYDIMKSTAQAQAQVNGGIVNITELHRTLVALPEFQAVPIELKEMTLRNFYMARRADLRTKELPEGVTERTEEQVNAILPRSGGGSRAKLKLA